MSEKFTRRCPECGCAEYTDKNALAEGYRVCAKCGQEWWTDVNYANKDQQMADLKAELEKLTEFRQMACRMYPKRMAIVIGACEFVEEQVSKKL